MFVVLPGDFTHMNLLAAILFHMFNSSSAEPLGGHWGRFNTNVLSQGPNMTVHRIHTVIISLASQGPFLHFFKSYSKHTISNTSSYQLLSKNQGR